ncbi:excinuclease ABC subunit UvrC [Clostridium sp. D2Q-11]|uniref:UvrABC system protein C n=1 Tax=Anaeromonas frigoriresistens TaxID=2683708 RepID=A0A942Z6B8_9FIRM|nr:excinuclease ABC subunit UvrC [Anaeromonas frigoriresistens]MBS4537412.1 excinuclease ABC subunit UvrC [Anaeromonas frigoriresistens]
MHFDIQEELKKLPDSPGVYLMKDEKGQIIYVGKANSLKKRVRQYFQSSSSKSTKVKTMVSHISEFEYILTDSEIEALILESNLIKKHKPKYNVLLRDDKQYPYIKVTVNESYPRVIKTRKVLKDGSKYFGPYTSTGAVNDTLNIIRDLYPIRTCKLKLEEGKKVRERPCLNYFIGKCQGPCMGNVNHGNYMEMINEIVMFLNGREEKLIEIIKEKMSEASKNLDFEEAARYRDQLVSLQHILEKQKIISTTTMDQDIIGMAKGMEDAIVQTFFVRNGKLIGREHFIISDIEGQSREEILASFTKQFYMGSSYIPKEILIEEEFEDMALVARWLSEKRGSKVYIKMPKRGEKNHLMEMVRKNALQALNQYSDRIKRNMNENKSTLMALKEVLGLEHIPNRIEAFDISNIQGVESVGSMVVFEEGNKKSSDYRRFKIKSIEGPNDYGSMEEILWRRFKRAIEESKLIKENKVGIESFSILPDLIMMDGGKGQVNIALKVIEQFNLNIPVCGMIKDDFHKTRGLIYNNKEITIAKNTEVFKLITRIQDEAHRFAISYHRSLRDKKLFKSVLDDISGIGDKRKKALLRTLGSIDNIKTASTKELQDVEGMNIISAEAVYNFFRKK